MDQEFIAEEYDEGLTFGKIGYFFKKGWLRMLIYVCVLVLLTTAIAVPIKVFYKSEPMASTSVEFIYDGIEKGLAPDGSNFDSDMMISTTVLSNAVAASGLNDVITDISKLRESMRVEGVLTDEYIKLTDAAANGDSAAAEKLRTYTMFSTRFNVILSDPDELGLNDDQAELLLGNVISSFYDEFQRRFSVVDMFASDMYILSSNNQFEFTDIYDMYVNSLSSVKTYLNTLTSSAQSFTSHKENTTFSQLLSELTLLSTNYDLFNAFILSNNVWRNATTAKNVLISTRSDINNKLSALETYISALETQIKNINNDNKPTIDITTSGQMIINYPELPEIYSELNDRLDESNRQILDYNTQLANIETRLERLENGSTGTAADIASAETTLKTLETQTATFVKKVNATIEDYYDTSFVSSSVRQTLPPVMTRRSLDFNILIVYAVAVIAGLLIAGFVTAIKISKGNAAREKAESVKADDKKTEQNTEE